jgi:hypothetical protein
MAAALGFTVTIKFERDKRGPRTPPPGRKR